MKTKILMVAITLIFISCSSSDYEPTDPIVGHWELTSIVSQGFEFINSCKSKDNIEIRSNKTFTLTSHKEDDNCAEESVLGKWAYITNNKYEFSAAGDKAIFTLTSDNSLTFSFEQDSKTAVYTYKKE